MNDAHMSTELERGDQDHLTPTPTPPPRPSLYIWEGAKQSAQGQGCRKILAQPCVTVERLEGKDREEEEEAGEDKGRK
jgi:hypothetical protein